MKNKNKFSTKWKSSKRPGKQRKYLARAPIHLKKKLLSTNLSKELRKKYGKRSLPLRKNDIVRVMRGKFKKKKGKIISVNVKRSRVEIEGLQVKKQDGSKANVKFHPSNLQIVEMMTEDRRRNIKSNKSTAQEEKKNAPKKTESS